MNLRGEIGIPKVTKAGLYLSFLFFLLFAVITPLVASSLGGAPVYIGVVFCVFLVINGALIRFGFQGDVYAIADALDAGLA